MTIPVGFVYMLGFSVIILPAMVVQHTGVRFFHQNVLHAGICPQELPITGFVRMPDFSAALFSSELRRCLSPRSVEPPGDLFLPTTLQVKRIDKLHRDRRFCVYLDLPRIFVFPVAEGRRDHDAVFLLLSVSRPDLFANILRLVIVHQAADTDDQVVFVAECINALRGRDHSHLVFPQIIDEQCSLGSMAAKPG